MKYDQVLKYFETQTKAAEAVDLTQTRMTYWKVHGIPIAIQCQFEVITHGMLKAERKLLKMQRK